MSELNDYDFFKSSKLVYEKKYLNDGTPIEINKKKWIVVKYVDKKGYSDLQAIAIVSEKDYLAMQAGKIDEYSSMTFVSRGTSSVKDFLVDGFELGIGNKPENNQKLKEETLKTGSPSDLVEVNTQFSDYQSFVKETLANNPAKNYNFTGHSLGGALAQYMAALTDKEAITFAAARAYRLLPEDIQAMADAGYYDNSIVDYRLDYDVVGNVPLGFVIGSRYSLDYNQLFTGHSTATFEKYKDKLFDSKGNSKIKVTPKLLRQAAYKVDDTNDRLKQYHRFLGSFMDGTRNEIQSVYRHYMNKVGSGHYDLLTENDVSEWFEEHAYRKDRQSFVFYDIDGLKEHEHNIHTLIKDVETISKDLIMASEQYTKMDHTSSKLFESE